MIVHSAVPPVVLVVEDEMLLRIRAVDMVEDAGYTYSSSVNPIRHDLYGMPDAPRVPFRPDGGALWELPMTTLRAFGRNWPCSGGGYFRILPYAWTRWGIERLNHVEGQPAIFYLHPWEIDPAQPRLVGRSLSSLRHYSNLAGCEGRLKRLISEFPFGRLADILAAARQRSSAAALASRPS
jgi:polysaccharide deacetylase family protein (PEP-CTERM system associated)